MSASRLLAMGLAVALTLPAAPAATRTPPSRGRQGRGRHDQRHQSAGSRHAATGRQPAVGADRVPVELQLAAHRRQLGDAGAMLRTTMPRAFRIALGRIDDGQHRLLHQRRTDQRPTRRSVTYTINPKAVWSDGTPDHMGGHRIPDRRHQRQEQGLPDRQPQRQRPRRHR